MPDVIAGSVFLDIEGLKVQRDEIERLCHSLVGGVILFSRNFQSRDQLKTLTHEIKQIRPDLIVAVDQEGGRVQRFKDGFTRLPSLQVLNRGFLRYLETHENTDKNIALTCETRDQHAQFVKDVAWLMASELRAAGVDMSFAPVLDVDSHRSRVIGDRSFGDDAEVVVRLGRSFIAGMHEAGMPATGKHFPGHGGIVEDTHVEIAQDPRAWEALQASDLKPFTHLASVLDAVMPAHVIFPSVSALPVGFSEEWLQKILRVQLGFDGLVFSDDLSMAGAATAGGYEERAEAAFRAGCHVVLICNNPQAAHSTLTYLAKKYTPASAALALFRQRFDASEPLSYGELESTERWRHTRALLKNIIVMH